VPCNRIVSRSRLTEKDNANTTPIQQDPVSAHPASTAPPPSPSSTPVAIDDEEVMQEAVSEDLSEDDEDGVARRKRRARLTFPQTQAQASDTLPAAPTASQVPHLLRLLLHYICLTFNEWAVLVESWQTLETTFPQTEARARAAVAASLRFFHRRQAWAALTTPLGSESNLLGVVLGYLGGQYVGSYNMGQEPEYTESQYTGSGFIIIRGLSRGMRL
jgi:hypothetical protein